ncbi:hypothetical protein MLD38_002258 [Melastoma candidum]|uniref:Uncharacterized protein n=1 Tax=Melastoma candidum TaxID=119954 RepID=A0ACB9SPG3_9MYRT|nr:hypothetical protein MLD38_002258 [Melastoma candidum]
MAAPPCVPGGTRPSPGKRRTPSDRFLSPMTGCGGLRRRDRCRISKSMATGRECPCPSSAPSESLGSARQRQ